MVRRLAWDLVFLIVLSTLTLAAPVIERQLPADAPYTQPSAVYEQAITCPNGIQNKTGGIVFLVHGTGSTANESWSHGPYFLILPSEAPGYDICWVDLPNRAMGDAQLSAEYVAYGISYLAPKSATHMVNIIGDSQGGGLNPQWALTFWPSKRRLVSNYIALSADFRGSAEIALICTGESAIGCQPSIWQQSSPSNYVSAQNSNKDTNSGAQALVPTASIFTRTDDVIGPELTNDGATSNLPGAAVHALQDLDVCGLLHVADHVTMIVDPAAFGLAYATLLYGAQAAINYFDKRYCSYFVDDVLLNFTNVPPLVNAAVDAVVLGIGLEPRVKSEPLLQPYVCQRGYAPPEACQATSGFAGNYVR